MTPPVPSKEEPRRARTHSVDIDMLGFATRARAEIKMTGAQLMDLIDERDALRAVADAGVAYVAARERNDGAEPCDWSACAAEVDRTWHDLKSLVEGTAR